ncbi:hypothetical protein D3C71_778210 [compost metagenome]
MLIHDGGPGTGTDLQNLFQSWAFWFMVVAMTVTVTIAMTVIIITTACLCCDCHHCCESENQWFQGHCRFHGVSPCLLVG